MRYWEELNSTYGFSDGISAPEGIELYRKAYIIAVNLLAAEKNCKVRVVAYDRPGLHNPFRVTYLPIEIAQQVNDLTASYTGMPTDFCGADNTLDEIVCFIEETIDVDSFVIVSVRFSLNQRKRLVRSIKKLQKNTLKYTY